MLLSKISLRGSGVTTMTVTDQSGRAWGFKYISGKSSDLVAVLEQARCIAPADSTVFSDSDNRGKVRAAGLPTDRCDSENLGGHPAMEQLSQNEPYQNGNSICAELVVRVERELSAFFSAVAELFGPEQATLAAKDWLQQLEVMTDLPGSAREWRALSIEASAKLAKRVNAKGFAASR
jgi:hypothetical protein